MDIFRIDRTQIGVLLIDVQPVFLEYAFSDEKKQK